MAAADRGPSPWTYDPIWSSGRPAAYSPGALVKSSWASCPAPLGPSGPSASDDTRSDYHHLRVTGQFVRHGYQSLNFNGHSEIAEGGVRLLVESCDDPSRCRAIGLAAGDDCLTVHEHVLDAGRVAVWVAEGRVVLDVTRVEYGDVGEVAGRNLLEQLQSWGATGG